MESVDRLHSNMKVIEGYIQRKPIFLEWLHGQVTIDELGAPIGFSDRFYSSHLDTVKVWFLTMHAVCGDMCLQGVDHLNLASFNDVNFPQRFKDYFTLSRLWLPNRFSGEIPDADVCWLYASNVDLLNEEMFGRCDWTLVLDGPPSTSAYVRDVSRIRGVDATSISPQIWREWCVLLKDAPIRYCALPETLDVWDGVPDWSATLKLLKVPPNAALFEDIHWYSLCENVEVLCMRDEPQPWSRGQERGKRGLKSLPRNLSKLQQLRWLDVSMNPIHQIPERFQTLQSLKTLNLAHTDLEAFPNVLLHLKGLKQLFIRNTNAVSTRKWLNILSGQHTNLSIRRVVGHKPLSLWELCLMTGV